MQQSLLETSIFAYLNITLKL